MIVIIKKSFHKAMLNMSFNKSDYLFKLYNKY